MAESQIYLSVGPDSMRPGKLIAVLSYGSPQIGDTNITVLSVEIVDSQEEAVAWQEKMMIERSSIGFWGSPK